MTKNKVFYVYDALCGWCYGFSPVVKQLAVKYAEQYDFEVISGGMVLGERAGTIGNVAPYIKDAYRQVEQAAGVVFGEKFLKGVLSAGTARFDSLPPSLALTAFKKLLPQQAVFFAGDLQYAIYHEGVEPVNIEAYADLATRYGIDKSLFLNEIASEQNKNNTLAEFKRAASMGVSGYPTLVVRAGEKLYAIARGYAPFEPIDKVLADFDTMISNR